MPNTAVTALFKANQQAAIARYFKGNQALYLAFYQAAMGQFPQDMDAAEAAIKASDTAALRRTAHNLKGALRMLGFASQEQQALQVELAACAGDASAVALAWQGLAAELQRVKGCYEPRVI
jgi:HPt (histidine-containing phosphotransfer) domain-containing protein